ncbi:uncharacterized protein LOC129230361 [Uloborus diversus]|uniref:uncharacterized protein LOC129230361 n=1 Tax=Uloborus diversus TaxID=327109 RepID=UPI002409BFBF|nr:uncharacterized protein LOC129230361 [Uloborus diversus]
MNFLRQEVNGEEMVRLARTGFGTNSNLRKREPTTEKESDLATAAALVSTEKKDSGSQSSYVSQKVLSELKATPLREETVIHSLFGGRETNPKRHKIFTVEVRGLKRSFACSFEALSERKICSFIPKVSNPYILNELKKKNIEVSDSLCKMKEIDLLIGADVLGKLLTGRSVDLESGLTAVEMKLGWTVMGKQNTNEKDDVFRTLSMHAKNIPLNELWELESIGITDPTCNVNKKACIGEHLAEFEDKLKILPCGRYEVELPWKHDFSSLPGNKDLAWKRHEKMISKSKCNNFLEDYQNVFKEWENLNIIERVPDSELENKCHYLPHRPVIKKDSKTTKVRPVFDASASQRGKPSLNECLFKGMNLIELIPDIIERFRLYPIGLSADIEKAFLMLSVAPEHRDFLRFFYPCDEGPLIYRHCRAVFGVTSSPFLLNISIAHLLENSPPEYNEIAQKLKCSFFVDNCVTGVHNTEEEAKFIEQSQLIMSKGCFNLRGFESNVVCENVTKHSGETSVLGILWNLDNDTLRCNINIEALTCDTKITKRLILSTVQKIFDSIGLLSPTTLLPKLILQDAWKLKHSWDLELPPDIANTFLKWAKSRVAPLKPLSIPRLELMACCIGARLLNSVLKALDFPNFKISLWSDSSVALWWIKRQENWSVFVSNRVKEIRELTQPELWKHVSGKMNIADVLSSGCSPRQFLDSKWWEGPTWLKLAPEKWPPSEVDCKPKEVDVERKRIKITTIDLNQDAPFWPPIKISSYEKFINVFGWVLRFVNNLQNFYFSEEKVLNGIHVFKDHDGILKVVTKITCREDNKSFLNPILLPDKCELSRLLIESIHRKYCHADVPMMLLLNHDELNTLICDCELVINSRPLTYVSENPQELIPLTPAMFLIENRSSDVTDIDHVDLQSLRKRIRYRYKLFNDLRQRFRKEYLGQLIQKHDEKPTREPRVGEIVLIGDDNKKRVFWPLAKIIELIPGRDKRVRAVRLKTQNGIFVRPVERVYPLEIRTDDEAVAISDKAMSVMESNPKEGVQKTSVKKCYPDIVLEKYTRSGRCVKVPKRLDLLNNECHMFETLPRVSKGGGMLETEVKRGPIE